MSDPFVFPEVPSNLPLAEGPWAKMTCEEVLNELAKRSKYMKEPDYTDINYRIKVMQHFAEGGEVQYRCLSINSPYWLDPTPITTPTWNWEIFNYRIKPQDKPVEYVPMEKSDFDGMPVIWARRENHCSFQGVDYLVSTLFEAGVTIILLGRVDGFTYADLFHDGWEYSTDRIHWKPFRKEKR